MSQIVVAYGDSMTKNLALAVGDRAIDRSIVGHGLAPDNLMPVTAIPEGHPVIFSCGFNNTDTIAAAPHFYQKLLANRLLEIAERTHGQPIAVATLEPPTSKYIHSISHETIMTANTVIGNAVKDAARMAQERGIPFNAHCVDVNYPTPIGHRAGDGLHYNDTGSRELYRRSLAAMGLPAPTLAAPSKDVGAAVDSITEARHTFSEAEMRVIQDKLREQGFDPGASDGKAGHHTMTAWRAFELHGSLQHQHHDGMMKREEVVELLHLPRPTHKPVSRG